MAKREDACRKDRTSREVSTNFNQDPRLSEDTDLRERTGCCIIFVIHRLSHLGSVDESERLLSSARGDGSDIRRGGGAEKRIRIRI